MANATTKSQQIKAELISAAWSGLSTFTRSMRGAHMLGAPCKMTRVNNQTLEISAVVDGKPTVFSVIVKEGRGQL